MLEYVRKQECMTQPFPPSGQASSVVVVLQSYAAGTWMANRLAAPPLSQLQGKQQRTPAFCQNHMLEVGEVAHLENATIQIIMDHSDALSEVPFG